MKRFLFVVLAAACLAAPASADLVISQYTETNSGSTPKGIELWNISGATIDFSVTGLDILQGTNGGSPSSRFVLNTGTLAPLDVIVVGTSDMFATATGNGSAFFTEPFQFNGDDSLVIELGGNVTDTFGTPGSDPGSNWSGSGVSTANQNIALSEPVDLDTATFGAFTDPSIRFTTIANGSTLTGFGIAPTVVAVPEPSAFLFGGLVAGLSVLRRRG